MKKIFSKINNSILLLVINKKQDITSNRTDLCPSDQFLQISTKILTNNTTFRPHKHLKLERNTDITQEAWIILSGKIKCKFYDLDDSIILEEVLSGGDCAVVFKAGHSFEVLEDNTILYEVKNGPYYGTEKDKTFID